MKSEGALSSFRITWKGRGIKYRRIEHNGVPSVLALPKEGYAPVLLMSHIDVVDADKDMFTPRQEGGALYGRGSLDDKYAARPCPWCCSKTFLRTSGKGDWASRTCPSEFLITGDEEVGGYNGAKYSLNRVGADFCIALDGGSLSKIVVKEKGLIKLKLISRGMDRPWGQAPGWVKTRSRNLIDDYRKISSFFEESAPDHWHRTLNFSIVHAGKICQSGP